MVDIPIPGKKRVNKEDKPNTAAILLFPFQYKAREENILENQNPNPFLIFVRTA